ncbi:methionine--tRNA ligase [Blattabacterium cuenoti]|uniref:methionine--tRNA ligase n=1 Tax=Blattabacterium cuenoti TaxID=1653831 RepID=UPI00163BA01C|nr:methionine--tRNA ligase [Blattabacterium cuenoti]
MKPLNKYIVTAAFPYSNGPIHIGHLAGVYVPADIFVRCLKRKNNKIKVIFICGADEHGVPITMQAKKENKIPKEIVNKYYLMMKNCFHHFGIRFDNFSRTSAKIHHKLAISFFKEFSNKNILFEQVSEQYYDSVAQQFLPDRYLSGTCPLCKSSIAYGDQCENCGSTLSSEELINPISTINGSIPILKKTKHWYLPLNKYQKFLEKWILKEHKNDWKVNVYGQAKSWLHQGLTPRAITRDLNWGIPIPKYSGKVLYVWFEAVLGYISSTIEWAQRNRQDWKSYWKDDKTKLIQFIGKDNIVFHCIIFPIILKAYNKGYILPYQVVANEFMNLDKKKISTSKGWGIWIHEYLKEFPNQQDTLRYVLISKMPENKDSNFNWKDFQTKNNMELVAILGNFVHRSITLIQKYSNGIVPTPGCLSCFDKKILKTIQQYPKNISQLIETFKFRDALGCFMDLARIGNKYLTKEAPWKNTKRLNSILYIDMQILGMLSQLSEPFLPYTSEKLFKIMRLKSCLWNQIQEEIVSPGHRLGKPLILFQKITNDCVKKQLKKLNNI